MRVFILILLAVCTVALADSVEVYRWVDENGQAHYSDRPQEGAEKVTLSEAQTFSTPKPQQVRRRTTAETSGSIDGEDDKNKVASYKSVKIVSPTESEVLWNTEGFLKVSVSVQPNLRRGHTLMIFLDDRMVEGLTGSRREAELTEVFRGDHTLRAEVRDAAGDVIADGNSVTFTVQQTSILNPNNPNVPPVPAPFGPGG